MSHNLFTWIITPIVFGSWIYLGATTIKAYVRLMRTKGISLFMTKKEIKEIKDPAALNAIAAWKATAKRTFVIWVLICSLVMICAIVINATIGFKE
jgi:hypothetical protein